MKRHIALLASLLILSCTAAVAQDYVPTPVTISSEKVRLNGKVYYAHLVLERQTLYSIAKAYGVTEQDLYDANPSLRETGLQKSSILLIPIDRQKGADIAVENAAEAAPARQPQPPANSSAPPGMRNRRPRSARTTPRFYWARLKSNTPALPKRRKSA